MKKLIQNKIVWITLFFILIIVFNFIQTEQKNEVVFANQSKEENVIDKETENEKVLSADKKNEIMIDVKGAIKNPGVFQCKKGDRVFDAIRLAGGFQEKADQTKINLAEKLFDEMVIYVPVIGEEVEQSDINLNSVQSEKSDAIDINHASQSELEKIPGIGPAKAKNILEYIETNGPFSSVEQLDEVNGIGNKSLEQMSPFIIIR
jgi:competence protein ComEA